MSRWVVVLSLGAGLFVMGAQVRAQALEKSALGSWGVQGTLAKAPGATCAAGKSTRGTSGPRGMGQKAPGATCAAGKSGPGGVGNEREAGPETTWHGRRWTLEAGIGVFGSHALSEFRHDAVGVAGWVGVGGEHIRVEVAVDCRCVRGDRRGAGLLAPGSNGERNTLNRSSSSAVPWRIGLRSFGSRSSITYWYPGVLLSAGGLCRMSRSAGDMAATRVTDRTAVQMSRDARRV